MILLFLFLISTVNGNRDHLGHKYEDAARTTNHIHRRLSQIIDENDDYNEISDDQFVSTKKAERGEENVMVYVPISKIVTMQSVSQEQSPLNVSFIPVLGEVVLEENLTVQFSEESIVNAVVGKVQDILTEANPNASVEDVIDILRTQNVTLLGKKIEKDPIDVYMKLLDNIILPETENYKNEKPSNSSHEKEQNPTSENIFESNSIESIISNEDVLVLENFSEEDLLDGDSFETEGNINLMNSKEPEENNNGNVDEITSAVETKKATNAFPELYKDLAIFKSPTKLKKKRRIEDNTKKIFVSKFTEHKVSKVMKGKQVKPEQIKKKISLDESSSEQRDEILPVFRDNVNFPKFQTGDEVVTDLLVKTSSGSIQGQYKTSSAGEKVKEFLGIPYASPPIGKLRFKSPQPPVSVNEVMNSTIVPPKCWSSHAKNSWDVENTEMSENCLYLSIWTPILETEKQTSVVVILNSGRLEGNVSGIEFASIGNVVVVTVENRHGSLGYLATSDQIVTANIGLQDQTLALKWIQENIDLFGGDSSKVTLLGNGKEGSDVSLHMLSPTSCHLFNNIILQSTAPFRNTVSLDEASKRSVALAKLVGCESPNNDQMVDCLRTIDPQVLINQEQSVVPYQLNIEPFPPTIDGNFLLEDPDILVDNNVFKKTSLLIGTNANEGMAEMMEYLPELGLQENLFEMTKDQLNSAMSRMFHDYSKPILNLIKFQYGVYDEQEESKTMKMKRFFGLQSALSDKEVICVVDKIAKVLSKDGNKVFKYLFNPLNDNISAKEMTYILGEPLKELGKSSGGLSQIMSKQMIEMWAAFSKYGDPNVGNTNTNWTSFSHPDWSLLKLENEEYQIENDVRERVCLFWDSVVPQFLPPKPDKLSRRSGPQELSCKTVKQSRIYFPGYRSIVRL